MDPTVSESNESSQESQPAEYAAGAHTGRVDPLPYVASSYAIGGVLLGGYFIWVILGRRKLRIFERTLQGEGDSP